MNIKCVKTILGSMAKALEAHDFVAAQSLILPLKARILELEKENAELKVKNHEYANKIKEYDEWEKTKDIYKPYKTSWNTIVIVPREEKEIKEFFCPNCYAHKIIVYLQSSFSIDTVNPQSPLLICDVSKDDPLSPGALVIFHPARIHHILVQFPQKKTVGFYSEELAREAIAQKDIAPDKKKRRNHGE